MNACVSVGRKRSAGNIVVQALPDERMRLVVWRRVDSGHHCAGFGCERIW